MADLYSVLSGIQPDQQDILEAELLSKQILEAKFPDLDLREGTNVRDLVLRPTAFLMALCKKGFDFYFAQNTLDKIDDTSPSELVDSLLSNLFLTRNIGTNSVINVRLFFARQKSVTLTSSTSFSTDGSLLFFPAVTSVFPQEVLQYDSYQNEWFLDVDLIASDKGVNYNIGSGSLLYFSNFDPFFLHGEINYLSEASTSPETNTQFLTRAKSSISTRNLINNPSINSRLTSEFPYLTNLGIVGAGNIEMHRDLVQVSGGPGVSRNATSMTLVDSDLNVLVNLNGHGYIVGQLLDIIESGSSPTRLILRRVPVLSIENINEFKIQLPVTISPRSLLYPVVTPIENDLYIHQGGCTDIHCSHDATTIVNQYTLDSNGSCVVDGPIYKIVRSLVSGGASADTLGSGITFTTSYPGHVTTTDVSFAQPGDGSLHMTRKNHCFTVGRMVRVDNFSGSNPVLHLMVTEIVDDDTVKLGRNLAVMTPGGPGTLSVTYVYPGRDVGFSSRQSRTVTFGPSYSGLTASLALTKFEHVEPIQDYLELSSNRVVCADMLARGFDIYVLDFSVAVYDSVAPTSGEVSALITPFLKSLAPGQAFVLADLVSVLTSTGGIAKIRTPVGVTYSYYTKDLFIPVTGSITDVVSPQNSTSMFILGSISTSTASV